MVLMRVAYKSGIQFFVSPLVLFTPFARPVYSEIGSLVS